MYLSHLTNKEIYTGNAPKGVVRGVGVSLKSHAVKYLLCSSLGGTSVDFSVSANAVERVDEGVRLSTLRPLVPKNCARVFIGRPVYAFDGAYLGKIIDLEMQNFTATHLFTDQNAAYPVTSVTASADAVLLKREQLFPLGQRIPAPVLFRVSDKKSSVVTKQILRAAIEKGELIRLTLSLSPFGIF